MSLSVVLVVQQPGHLQGQAAFPLRDELDSTGTTSLGRRWVDWVPRCAHNCDMRYEISSDV